MVEGSTAPGQCRRVQQQKLKGQDPPPVQRKGQKGSPDRLQDRQSVVASSSQKVNQSSSISTFFLDLLPFARKMSASYRLTPLVSALRSAAPLSHALKARPAANATALRPRRPHHRFIASSSRLGSEHKQPTRLCSQCGSAVSHTTSPCPDCSTLLPIAQDVSHHSVLSLSEPVAGPSSASSSSSGAFDIPSELAKLPARGFDLDPRDLRQRMLQRQKDLHPDKFGSKGPGAVELAREASGRVNTAYQVLSDPLKRAEYIVSVLALDWETRADLQLSVHDLAPQETDSLTDPDLLMEIMEAREELEEAESSDIVEAIRQRNAGASGPPQEEVLDPC